MGPKARYQELLASSDILADDAQAATVEAFETLYQQLASHRTEPEISDTPPLVRRLLRMRPNTTAPAPQGIYIWGGAGRGKTWLMDLFFNELPFEDKRRYHFHELMGRIHAEMNQLKGQPDPLGRIAAGLATKARVICLDEFIVTDIGDAMILHRLLHELFRRRVVLVTSSNTAPAELYENGLQRDRFLPAIGLLQQHSRVIELAAETDYRLRTLEHARIYHTPLGPRSDTALADEFERLAPEQSQRDTHITVVSRQIPLKRLADDVAWFDFMALCGPPRSQADYLELANRFHTVFISDIPVLGAALDDACRRFIYLIDCFYDRHIKLIVSAARPAPSLYQGERLAFDFQRTISRLHEMQSKEYLARERRVIAQ